MIVIIINKLTYNSIKQKAVHCNLKTFHIYIKIYIAKEYKSYLLTIKDKSICRFPSQLYYL